MIETDIELRLKLKHLFSLDWKQGQIPEQGAGLRKWSKDAFVIRLSI
jgi:hypothetical protein